MRERAVLVAIEFDRDQYPLRSRKDGPEGPRSAKLSWSMDDELQELTELARSAGCEVVEVVRAKRHDPVAATLIGSGKIEEIGGQAKQVKAQVVIFNRELSPAQQRNIEDVVAIKTIDRTQLILDIFAQRAKSQEGKVQVELAQLRYLLPRLVGKGIALSRLGGGVGTRGPGETKLEVDRRRIRERITRVLHELEKLSSRREATRRRRRDARVFVAALVGYTNAGKTTLLNRLTGADSLAQDRPFTTLDPLARRMRLPSGNSIVVTDTVGFLHRLPHHLIEAFKATLEEAEDADVLIHVLDASHPLALEQAEAVREVLGMLDLREKPVLTALNKIDQLPSEQAIHELKAQLPMPLPISARTGAGLDELLRLLEDAVRASGKTSTDSGDGPPLST